MTTYKPAGSIPLAASWPTAGACGILIDVSFVAHGVNLSCITIGQEHVGYLY